MNLKKLPPQKKKKKKKEKKVIDVLKNLPTATSWKKFYLLFWIMATKI